MKPKQLQTIYLRANGDQEKYVASDNDAGYFYGVIEKEAIIFTPEELNEYTANVIKQALFSTSEFAELQYECGKKSKENCLAVFCGNCTEQIDKQSITNTFEQIYEKWKI